MNIFKVVSHPKRKYELVCSKRSSILGLTKYSSVVIPSCLAHERTAGDVATGRDGGGGALLLFSGQLRLTFRGGVQNAKQERFKVVLHKNVFSYS